MNRILFNSNPNFQTKIESKFKTCFTKYEYNLDMKMSKNLIFAQKR